jgi:hypothetical protein
LDHDPPHGVRPEATFFVTACAIGRAGWPKLTKSNGRRIFFDHRLRDDEQFNLKADYILHNPVRAGLVTKVEDWPYLWMSNE